MRSTLLIRFALSAACTAALIPTPAAAQEVVFFDDYSSEGAKYPVPQPKSQPSARRVGRSVSSTRIPAGVPMPNSMSRQQAAQAFNQQADAQSGQQTNASPLSKLGAGIKGLFSRDEAQPQQQATRAVQPAAFGAAPAPRSNTASRGRSASGGVAIRQGDQRRGLFDLAFGSDDSGPSQPSQPSRQVASRSNTRKPTARSNRGSAESAMVASATPQPRQQRSSSAGPASLPQLSGSPLPAMNRGPAMGPVGMPTALPPQQNPRDLSKPSDGVVMVSDQEAESSEPMVFVSSDDASDDEPLFITDLPGDQPESAPAAKPQALASAPQRTEPAPKPLIIENTKADLPIVTTPPAPVRQAPTVEPSGSVIASVSAPQPTPRATQPKPVATPKPMKRPQAKPQPAAKVAVLPNPVKVAEEEQAKQCSERAAALLAEAHYLARDAQSEEEFTRVVQQCRHVLAIDESEVAVQYSNELASWALNKRGELKADLGMMKEAMVDFNDAVTKDAGQWRAVHNRGVLMAQSGDFSQAFDAFNKTIELNPKFAKAHSNRASLYVQAGEFETALSDYKRAISLDPDLIIAHKGRGRVCHVLGRLEEALQHFEAAALLSPEDAGIATCRADLLVDMGRYAQAAAGYVRAIDLDPQDPIAHRNLAWLQATCPDRSYQDGQRAVANASRAIELSGAEDDICLDTLAAAQAAAGDFPSAIETIKEAISLAPSSDQSEYAERLKLYEEEKPFRTTPAGVRQASYSDTNGAGLK